MKTLNELLIDVTNITMNMETNYPELYQFLGESPETIPSTDHPDITIAIMQDYLESLEQLLKHHLETHNSKK